MFHEHIQKVVVFLSFCLFVCLFLNKQWGFAVCSSRYLQIFSKRHVYITECLRGKDGKKGSSPTQLVYCQHPGDVFNILRAKMFYDLGG